MLRDVSHRDMATSALGSPVAMPFGVSPTAMQRMAHPDGELANARGERGDDAMCCLFLYFYLGKKK